MSEQEFQHELDDELLSAYLDDELTAEERATVEARLANDPEAKQLLHQLRSVSQSVQALPEVPLRHDLREQILRRAEAVKPAASGAAEDTAARLGAPMPTAPFFQTRRSWIWASLAMAAGLLIMVLQSGDVNQKNLPAVAQNDRDSGANRQRNESLPRQVNEPTSAAPADAAKIAKSEFTPPAVTNETASPSSEVAGVDKLAIDGLPDMSPEMRAGAPNAAASTRPLLSDVPADEQTRSGRFAAPGQPLPPARNLGDKAPMTASSPAPASAEALATRNVGPESNGGATIAGRGGRQSPSIALPAPQPKGPGTAVAESIETRGPRQPVSGQTQSPLLVVHVLATPEAMQKRTFDQLLASKRIAVDVERLSEGNDRSGGNPSGAAKRANAPPLASTFENNPTVQATGVDAVLVDAPKSTILECLAELKKDTENFVSLEVGEPVVAQEKNLNGSLIKKLASDLDQYNRGVISEKQKDLTREGYYYRDTKGGRTNSLDEREDAIGAADQKSPVEETKQVRRELAAAESKGRARRLSRSEVEDRRLGQPVAGGGTAGATPADASSMRRAQMKPETTPNAADDNMQVLFVLSPERAAVPGAPAEKSAK